MARAPNEVPVGEHGLVLRRLTLDDTGPMLAAVERSLPELRRWMPWSAEQPTMESIREFIEVAGAEAGSDETMGYGLFEPDGEPVGGFGLHARRGPGTLEIGYWVRTDRTGRGYATAAARALTAAAFEHFPEVDRVEIRCHPDNRASAAIPPKLGYRLDGEVDSHLVWVLDRRP